ncbi:redoxin domain-containing protein [Carboxylicivirga sp. N1Y90]|uniref:redoxin domain-containing protein n=1 Tax=Carboxylicivirga fragile TaxID=3417571 RepID=UPI003D33E4C7|nr:AhpC/TSA family protein [Marinilabiliaceae bacterium N1Y90]
MKKLMLAIVSVAMLVACQPKGYQITGTLEGATGQAILNSIRKGQPVAVDTVDIVNGQFAFSGMVDAPELYLLFIEGQQRPVQFFVENTTITINGNMTDMDNIEVTGSNLTELFKQFENERPGKERQTQIQQEYMQAQMTQNKDAMQQLGEEMNAIMEDQKAYYKQFAEANTDNELGALLSLGLAQTLDLEALKALVEKLEVNMKDHVYVQEMRAALEPLETFEKAVEAVKEGAVAPDFTLLTADSTKVTLSSFRGKYVLVDFWASWCGPCRQENPNVVKAYNAYNAKGFEVLSVSVDQDKVAWQKAVKEDGLVWTNVISDEATNVPAKYAIQSIPTTFLLDKEGVIIAKNLRGDALEKKLAELLK